MPLLTDYFKRGINQYQSQQPTTSTAMGSRGSTYAAAATPTAPSAGASSSQTRLGGVANTQAMPSAGATNAAISPALAAMGGGGSQATAQQQSNAAAQPPPPRPDQMVAATVDMGPSVELYNKMLADNAADWAKQQESLHNIYSANNRRNASNAALAGMSVGGGGYLAGQRQAAASSANAFNNAWQANAQQRQGIYGQYAGALGSAATNNAGFAQQAGMSNVDWQREQDRMRTEAQTANNTNQNIASVAQVKVDYDYLFNDKNFKEKSGQYNSLFTAYKNSLSTGSPAEQAAAYKALMDFIGPLNQARDEYNRTGGGEKNGDFRDWYKKHYGNL